MPTLLWIESGSCSGESMAILGADGSGRGGHNLMDFLEKHYVELLWHPSLSLESPKYALRLFERIEAGEQALTLLCVEGSIIHGPDNTGQFDTFRRRAKRDIIHALCQRADYVFAMGTCSAYGGIPAAPPNPSGAGGLQFDGSRPGGLLGASWRSRAGLPVINLAGCPVDAATMIRTLTWVLQGMPLELDKFNRPFTVRPCLSHPTHGKCGTAEQVGYACYGCIAPKFPVSRPLFDHQPLPGRVKPYDPCAPGTYAAYGMGEPALPALEVIPDLVEYAAQLAHAPLAPIEFPLVEGLGVDKPARVLSV